MIALTIFGYYQKRLTVEVVENLISDLKVAVQEAKGKPLGQGTMVAIYGSCDLCVHVRPKLERNAFAFRCRKCWSCGAYDRDAVCFHVPGRNVQGVILSRDAVLLRIMPEIDDVTPVVDCTCLVSNPLI